MDMNGLHIQPGIDSQHACPDCGTPFMMTVMARRLQPSRLLGLGNGGGAGKAQVEVQGVPVWGMKLCLWCLRREVFRPNAQGHWELFKTMQGAVMEGDEWPVAKH